MGEKHIIEYKKIWKDDWLEWICGMANADGGTIYIGISDDEEVVGVSNPKKWMEDIPNKIISKMAIYPDVRLIQQEGKDIIEIDIKPSMFAVSLDGVVYKRVGANQSDTERCRSPRVLSQQTVWGLGCQNCPGCHFG